MKQANGFNPPAPLGKIEYADLYTFTLRDGTVLRYTNYDQEVFVPGPGGGETSLYGGVGYSSTRLLFSVGPVIKRSRLTWELGLKPAELTVTIGSKPTDIAQPFLGFNWPYAFIKGLFDWAKIQVWRLYGPFAVNAAGQIINNTITGAQRPMPLFSGYIAELISASRQSVAFKALDVRVLLNTQIPRTTLSPYCRWALFGAGCLLNAENFGVSTTALAGSTASILLAALTKPSGYFDLGYVKFLSGANQGQQAPVAAHYAANASYESLVLQAKPKCYLRLNETSGTTAHDASGNGNNGTISGDVILGKPSLLTGEPTAYAALFNSVGTNGQIAISGMSAPNGGKAPMTIEMIIRNPNPAIGAIFETGPGLPSSIRCENGIDIVWLDKPDSDGALGISGPTVHLAVVVFDNRVMAVYGNGSLIGTYTASRGSNFDWSTFTLGQVAFNAVGNRAAAHYSGYIEEVAIYDYALDAGTIALHAGIVTSGPTAASSAQLQLLTPLPAAPAAGDSFRVYPGGDLTYQGCCVKFNNTAHFGGYPRIPDQENAL